MWWLLASLAQASEAPEPLPVSQDEARPPDPLQELPWQLQREEEWARIQGRATTIARAGGWVSIAAGGLFTTGALVLVLADETGEQSLYTTGGALVGFGAVGAIAGPPILLSSALRANHAMRERGVYVSSTAGITGWTMYGMTLFAAPLFVVAWPIVPFYYAGIVGAGFAQIETNRVGSRNARLRVGLVPTRRGLALTGTF